MRRSRRTTFLVLISVAALLCASMLAPAFGAPQATSAASLAKKLASTLKIAKRADRNAKRAIKGLQVEGKRGPAGPPGAAGAQGAKGDQGAPATRLWAVINASGTSSRGAGLTGSVKLTTGQYEVVFDRDVTACSYQATISASSGEAAVEPRPGVPNGVQVRTFTSTGGAADRAFHLGVFC
jgi:hypothetical protein